MTIEIIDGEILRFATSDEASIYCVTEAARLLRENWQEAKRVEIDLSQVTEIDSAFCQLVVSASRQCAHEKKPFAIVRHGEASERWFRNLGVSVA